MNGVRSPRVSFQTLGCKVNQYETRETAAELLRLGYELVPFGEPADVSVVNTCTVTEQADAKSRAAIRRAARAGDDPLVVATGCYVTASPAAAAAIPEAGLVVPNAEKPRLAEIIDETLRRSGRLLFPIHDPRDDPPSGELIRLMHRGAGTLARSRAVVKIQDGCNHFCSFCIIPFTRGRLRSRAADEIIQEARCLAELGFREIVLTGICIGDYGDERGAPASSVPATPVPADRAFRDPLALLIEELSRIDGIERIRLSSLDPADVTDDLLRTLADVPEACHHLHLSLQSGDEGVLRRMRRRYTAARFLELCAKVYRFMPDAGLTCDVIAGFPQESEAAFQATLDVCRQVRFLHIHAFPYSPRPGTAAAHLQDDVPHGEKQRRIAELNRLSGASAIEFAAPYVGRAVEVLVEQRTREGEALTGLAGNYLRAHFPGPDEWRGSTVSVIAERAGAGEVWGKVQPPAEARNVQSAS